MSLPLALVLTPACSGDGGGAAALAEVSGGDAAADALDDTQPEIGSDTVDDATPDAADDALPDTRPDTPPDTPPDAPDDADSAAAAEVDAGPELIDRAYSFRVIAGVSTNS